MAKRVMDNDHKAKLTQGRIEAKAIREKASTLFEEYGTLLHSWNFWKNISASDREAATEAIRKANMASLNADIKAMQAQLDAKIEEKESLAKR
jgi:ABC-type bacteriocin/lantibiotic exporter with double-glycine peptidase domain